MILTDLDIKILKTFLELKNEINDWQLMKKIYPRGSNREYMHIKRRIKRMSEYGLFIIQEGKFILIKDFVRLNNPPKIKNSISIQLDNQWEIFEI